MTESDPFEGVVMLLDNGADPSTTMGQPLSAHIDGSDDSVSFSDGDDWNLGSAFTVDAKIAAGGRVDANTR